MTKHQQFDYSKELAKYVHERMKGAGDVIEIPDINILVNLFEILFFVSLKTEESSFIKVTIAFIDPVISKPKKRQCNHKQTTKNINELTKTNHFDR